jgi:SAM-dependent methyltransferase
MRVAPSRSSFAIPEHMVLASAAVNSVAWDRGFDAGRFVRENADEFQEAFGQARLEETAFTVYTNRLAIARWLGLERVRSAARLARTVGHVRVAVDFGSGLGVSLPGLAARAAHVWAVDLDPEITRLALSKLSLQNVTVVQSVSEIPDPIDLLLALDVFEHVPDLTGLVSELVDHTREGGHWVVSGPTENNLYHLMRRISRTTGEGHIRSVDRVMEIVSTRLAQEQLTRLPIDTAQALSLFEVALFRNQP